MDNRTDARYYIVAAQIILARIPHTLWCPRRQKLTFWGPVSDSGPVRATTRVI